MKAYRVVLHGDGIKIPPDAQSSLTIGGDQPVIGFYATRIVLAGNKQDAANKAISGMAKEWSLPPYARANRGDPPIVTIDTIERIPLVAAPFARPRRGFTFYC